MNELATVVESMTRANKSLREVIRKSADEMVQLERFEEEFRPVRERFLNFKLTLLDNNCLADGVLSRLEQTLSEKRQLCEDLRKRVDHLKHLNKMQKEQNQKLERECDGNIARSNFVSLNNGKLSGSNWSSSSKIINRLLLEDKDTKAWNLTDHSG